MIKSSPTTNHPKFQRRLPALFGIVALVLFQISLASHQFKHVADHGFTACDICTTYNQLDDAPIVHALQPLLSIELSLAGNTEARPMEAGPAFAAYRSRAPPHS